MKKILFLTLSVIFTTYAQFDSLIFSKQVHLDYTRSHSIYGLGDINNDGYDDFMVYDCAEQKAEIFLGGNPVDTIPDVTIKGEFISCSAIDLNDDNINDMVLITQSDPGKKIQIYYGGASVDTIPDLSFSPPIGARGHNFGWWNNPVLNDFNGDGRKELVIYNPELPFSRKQFGTLYFYNTGSTFDTIPAVTVCGDSVDSVRIFEVNSSGDINGDGKTDLTLYGYYGDYQNNDNYFRRFYLGNEGWDMTPDAEYIQGEHTFKVAYMGIVRDLNKDGRDDIIIDDYGFYPYYYYNAVLKGSFPIDTIPDWGLNTQNLGVAPLKIVNLGDVNGDGFNDFMAPTYGIYAGIKLWLGGGNIHTVADKTWLSGEEGFCYDYAAVGDVNGDGTDDIAFGSIPYPGSDFCKAARVIIFDGDTTAKADTVLSLKDKNHNLQGYKLFEPYPNPFNPITTIKYSISGLGTSIINFVQLKVYDILGKEVAVLVNKEQTAGNYEIKFDGSRLASGVYIYRLTAGDFSASKKLVLLK